MSEETGDSLLSTVVMKTAHDDDNSSQGRFLEEIFIKRRGGCVVGTETDLYILADFKVIF